jgi:putative MATE family efflux protein
MKWKEILQLVIDSFRLVEHDFTKLSINKSIVLLAIPMLMEMLMESLFAIVDTYFVSALGKEAIATVGLTESLITIVYSIAIGISMAATAIVARRVGENKMQEAAKAGAQALTLGVSIAIVIGCIGIFFAKELLSMMKGSEEVVQYGYRYTQILIGSNIVIMILFLINGIYRGAGNATLAFRSLLVANVCNIIFCPIFIHHFGIEGAAVATLCGRGLGVGYQFYQLTKKQSTIRLRTTYFYPNKVQIKSIIDIAGTATLQFIIGSGSWIFLNRLIASHGDTAVAGYTIAIRVLIFFIMPAWGISNAAATLVGQNLGSNQPQRAEESVWQTAKVNAIFMLLVTLICLLFGSTILSFFTSEDALLAAATEALQIISLGYVVYGIGMVILNAFNGAGDSKTPTIVNFFGYWCFQIPLAWLLSQQFGFGKKGIYISIILAETVVMLISAYLFKKGKWKKVSL